MPRSSPVNPSPSSDAALDLAGVEAGRGRRGQRDGRAAGAGVGRGDRLAGLQAARVTESDADLWTARLAQAVLKEESAQWVQLLGGVEAIDVGFTLRTGPGAAPVLRPGTREGWEGRLRRVAEFYQGLDAPQRLVITGQPGAGKTVLAMKLILELLRDPPPGWPVPVRVSAAGWDPDIPVPQWLAGQLHETFGLKRQIAEMLVEQGRVLPVVDGLDEMDQDVQDTAAGGGPGYASRAGRALRALNDYQRAGERIRVVLTCRTGQYDALTSADTAARDAARIEIKDVAPDQAWEFLQETTGEADPARWQPVLDALTRDGHVLATALATPWRLTLAAAVYNERDPDSGDYLRDPADLAALTSEQAVRDDLLPRFVDARIAAAQAANRNAGRGVPHPRKTHRWLAELAAYLNANTGRPPLAGRTLSSTDLILHELWPIAPPALPRLQHDHRSGRLPPTGRGRPHPGPDRIRALSDHRWQRSRPPRPHLPGRLLEKRLARACSPRSDPPHHPDRPQASERRARGRAHVRTRVRTRGRARGRARDRARGRARGRARQYALLRLPAGHQGTSALVSRTLPSPLLPNRNPPCFRHRLPIPSS